MTYGGRVARYLADLRTSDDYGQGVLDMLIRSITQEDDHLHVDRLVSWARSICWNEGGRRLNAQDYPGARRVRRLANRIEAVHVAVRYAERIRTGGGSDG